MYIETQISSLWGVKINTSLNKYRIHLGKNYNNLYSRKGLYTNIIIGGTIIFEGNAVIYHGSNVNVAKGATLVLGDDFELGCSSNIFVSEYIEFGSSCMLSWNITVMDTDMHGIYDLTGKFINPAKQIKIGNNVWIGCDTTILKGSIINDGCVIAAKSLINKQIDDSNSIISDHRIIKRNVYWQKPLIFGDSKKVCFPI